MDEKVKSWRVMQVSVVTGLVAGMGAGLGYFALKLLLPDVSAEVMGALTAVVAIAAAGMSHRVGRIISPSAETMNGRVKSWGPMKVGVVAGLVAGLGYVALILLLPDVSSTGGMGVVIAVVMGASLGAFGWQGRRK